MKFVKFLSFFVFFFGLISVDSNAFGKKTDEFSSTIYIIDFDLLNSKLDIFKKITEKFKSDEENIIKYKKDEESKLSADNNEFISKAKTMSKKAIELKSSEMQKRVESYNQKINQMVSDLQKSQSEVMNDYIKSVYEQIGKYASDNSIPLIYNRSAILYFSKDSDLVNLTDDVASFCNKKIKSLKTLKSSSKKN